MTRTRREMLKLAGAAGMAGLGGLSATGVADAGSTYTIDTDLTRPISATGSQLDAAIRAIVPDSPLIGLGDTWIAVGQERSLNAVYMAAHAALESGWGKSDIAQTKNNIYGFDARDICPYECADGYESFEQCIREVMAYVDEEYLTKGGDWYEGPTLRGMNVHYATDDQWAEKIASIMNDLAGEIGATAFPGGDSGGNPDVLKPSVEWIPAYEGNYSDASRGANEIEWIVIHTIEGPASAGVAVFQDPEQDASAHYIVAKDGHRIQMVHDEDVAWHAGNGGYNDRSIGIEHAGEAGVTDFSDTLYESSAKIVKYLADQYGVPLEHPEGIAPADGSGGGIIGHDQVPDPEHPSLGGGISNHTDPGSTWDWERYMDFVGGVTVGGGGGSNDSGDKSPTVDWPLYQRGDRGPDIYTIQSLLRAHGYNLAVDGIYGPETENTVEAFQAAQGLAVDGIVGPRTGGALIITVSRGEHGWAVRAAQRQLGVTVDGIFGPNTEEAVREFQSAQGLAVDGIVGPNTWEALVPAPSPDGSASSSYEWPYFSRSDEDLAIYTVQYLLEEHGYDLTYHDGIYGPETEGTVERFQADHGLSVDGIVGPNTWSELIVTVADSTNDPWWATYAGQHNLRYNHGYDIAVDGYYGPETEGAITDFQRSAGLAVDGIVGPNTWQALVATT